jgi:hypothetical protein
VTPVQIRPPPLRRIENAYVSCRCGDSNPLPRAFLERKMTPLVLDDDTEEQEEDYPEWTPYPDFIRAGDRN